MLKAAHATAETASNAAAHAIMTVQVATSSSRLAFASVHSKAAESRKRATEGLKAVQLAAARTAAATLEACESGALLAACSSLAVADNAGALFALDTVMSSVRASGRSTESLEAAIGAVNNAIACDAAAAAAWSSLQREFASSS
jgi:hypothetical protein